jgi:hypothetical protein
MPKTTAIDVGDERICTKCELQQPLDKFRQFIRKNGKTYREGQCNQCRVKYAKNYFWDGLKELQEKKRAIVDDMKQAPCTDCNRTFPSVCMDFDHVRGEKKAGITQLVGQHWSVEVLMEEFAKCELVCACCHRIRTHQDKALHKSRINNGRKRAGLKCFL